MKLKRVEEIARGTCAYYFDRPSGFEFVPGQFVEVALEAASPSDPFRSFSIASAPSEPDLMIATRSRDSRFKQALRSLPSGSEVQIDGPYGNFGLRHDDGLAHVFIAGGIGITPIRSMLMQAAADGTREPMLLFYANQDITGTPFLREIAALTQRDFPFRFIPTLTRPSEGWTGEKGYVDAAMLSRHLVPSEATYYLSGSPAMVDGTREMLAAMGVGENRILFERLEGY